MKTIVSIHEQHHFTRNFKLLQLFIKKLDEKSKRKTINRNMEYLQKIQIKFT